MAFTLLLESGANVLEIGAPMSLLDPLKKLGISPKNESKDLRFGSYPRESWDGIWWEKGNEKYSIDDAHRVLSLFFQSLKPKSGVLALSFLKDSAKPAFPWKALGLQALLRQSGFTHAQTFESHDSFLYLCKRL